MTATAPRLRALDTCDVLDRAVSLYRGNLVTLLGIHAAGYVPFWLIVGFSAHLLSAAVLRMVALDAPSPGAEASLGAGFLGAIVLFLVFLAALIVLEPIVSGAMARAVADRVLGRPASISSAYAALRGRRIALVFSSLIRLSAVYGAVNLISLLGMVVVVVAGDATLSMIVLVVMNLAGLIVGACLFIYLAFLGQIIVIERRGVADALSRSWRLVSGRLWRTSAVVGFLALLVMALVAALQPPLLVPVLVWFPDEATPGGIALGTILEVVGLAVSSLLASPLLAIGSTLVYFDLRVRREGLDVALLAASISEPGTRT